MVRAHVTYVVVNRLWIHTVDYELRRRSIHNSEGFRVRRAKALISSCHCVGWSVPSMPTSATRSFFPWRGPSSYSSVIVGIQFLMYDQFERTYAPSEDSDQTAHSRSLIRIFTGRILDSEGCKVSSCCQRRLWSDCADAQADLILCWAHMAEGTFSHNEALIYFSSGF